MYTAQKLNIVKTYFNLQYAAKQKFLKLQTAKPYDKFENFKSRFNDYAADFRQASAQAEGFSAALVMFNLLPAVVAVDSVFHNFYNVLSDAKTDAQKQQAEQILKNISFKDVLKELNQ